MPLPSPANFVQPFSTGASFVYIGVGGGAAHTPVLLGTCEGYPKHTRRPQYMEVKNDISGRRIPLDMSFQGADAVLSLDMTVWDDGVAKMLERIPDVSGAAVGPNPSNPGTWRFIDVGVLMGLERLSIPIWILYTFANVRPSGGIGSAGSPGALPPGYHYFQAIPMESGTEEGAQPAMRNLNFYIWPITDFTQGFQQLFDYNMSLIATAPPIRGPAVA